MLSMPSDPRMGVFVHAYVRRRLGRLEHVSQHWRSWPGQGQLFP